MAIYFACSNFDVAVSTNKKKLRKFAKRNLRFAGVDLKIGVITRQTLDDPRKFIEMFGSSILHVAGMRLLPTPEGFEFRGSVC